MTIAAALTAFMFVIASCDKPEPDSGNGGLIDDTTQNDDQNGNQNGDQNGDDNQGDNNQGGNEPGVDDGVAASLKGSEYVLIGLDEYSTEYLGDKVKATYFVDDVTMHLYVWEGTYVGGTSSGLNVYGEAAPWTSLVVTSVGWSGCGWANDGETKAFVADAADMANWKFHIAYKGAANVPHICIINWNSGKYAFAIGEGTLEDSGVAYTAIPPVSGTFKPNVWNEYEVSLADMGIDFTKDAASTNMLSILSGGVAGTTLDVDAIFYYK